MKKYFGVLCFITLVLIASLLLGCGNSVGENTTTTTSQNGTTTTTQTSTTTQTQTQTQTQTSTQTTTTIPINDILALAANHTSVYYEITSEVYGQGTMKAKVWTKGNKVKIYDINNGMVIYVDTLEQTTYIYIMAINMIYKMKYDSSAIPLNSAFLLESNPTVLGQEIVDSKVCVVIESTHEGVVTKAWVWKATGFPLKIEQTKDGESITLTYTNYDFSDIDDAIYDLPAAPIIDMSSGTY